MGKAPEISDCLSVAWKKLQPQIGMLILTYLIFGIITLAASVIAKGIAGLIIGGPMLLGLFRVHRDAYHGKQVDVGKLFSGFKDFLPAFLNYLLFAIVTIIGLFLCIVPGIIVSIFLCFWPLLFDDGKREGVDALLASKDLVKPFWLPTVFTVFVLGLIWSAGLLVCGVGILLTGPIAMMGTIRAYETLRGSVDVAVPESPAVEGTSEELEDEIQREQPGQE